MPLTRYAGALPPLAECRLVELTPGTALHVPSFAPHWVKNGGEVSISFSAGFFTRGSERKHLVYVVNHYLRARGLDPVPAGRSPFRDALKRTAYRAVRRARRLWPRREPL